EVGAAEGGDGEGAGFAPVHAGAFEAAADQLFSGGFDHPGADLPAERTVGGIIGAVQTGLDVVDQFTHRFALAAPPAGAIFEQPVEQSAAALIVQLRQRLIGPSLAGVFVLGMQHAGRVPDMFAGVIPVKDALPAGKVLPVDPPAPLAAVGREDAFL